MDIFISETTHTALTQAAQHAQLWFIQEKNEHYTIADLEKVFVSWLESSIESLADDAFELCITGDRLQGSFNRQGFEQALSRIQPIQPIEQPQPQPVEAA
jgi:hypothetical protein